VRGSRGEQDPGSEQTRRPARGTRIQTVVDSDEWTRTLERPEASPAILCPAWLLPCEVQKFFVFVDAARSGGKTVSEAGQPAKARSGKAEAKAK
jgi:hypothetical protein